MVLEIGKGADGGLFLRGAKKLSTLELLNSCMRASQIKAGPIPSSRAQNQQRQHRPHRAGASSRPRLHENTFWRRGNCRPAPPPQVGAQRACLGGRPPIGGLTWAR